MIKLKKNYIIITTMIIISFNSLYAKEKIMGSPQMVTNKEKIVFYEEKDPFVAGLLSATMLGLGQFYVKSYTKGSIFVLVDLIQKGMIIYFVSSLNEKYTNEEQGDSIVKWNEISNGDQALILSFVAFYFGTRLYSIIDAMHDAEQFNRMNKDKYSKINFGYQLGYNKVGFSLNKHF